MWDPQWDALVAGHRVVRYDMRGFGRSEVEHTTFSNRDDLVAVMDAGARVMHVDTMDGRFVPPITIGALVVEALDELVHERGGILDCHLMVERPERQVEQFAKAGADVITIHPEATPHIHYAVKIKGREKFTTQCYVKGEPRNARDGILQSIRDPKARESIIVDFAPLKGSRIGELTARFDIVLGFTPEG